MKQNAAEPKELKERNEKLAQLRKQQDEALRAMLAFPNGRITLARIMAECQVFEEDRETSSKIYFNQGRRSVGLWLRSEMKRLDPEAFVKLELETLRTEENFYAVRR